MDVEASPELIARARRDPAAFGELYDLYLPRVYGFCWKYSTTREQAEDLTAETFERALAAIGGYEDREVPFSRWLLRIARNLVVSQARRAGQLTFLREHPELTVDERALDDWEEAHWLRGYVDSLSPDHREVVRLRFYEDQPFREVAVKMGRSEGAVKQLLRRALRSLHLEMQGEPEEGATGE
jgi:RNA polymerase sigma-70 factor (ECF subfamily)